MLALVVAEIPHAYNQSLEDEDHLGAGLLFHLLQVVVGCVFWVEPVDLHFSVAESSRSELHQECDQG